MTVEELKKIVNETEFTLAAFRETKKIVDDYVDSLTDAERRDFITSGGWSIIEYVTMMYSGLEHATKPSE